MHLMLQVKLSTRIKQGCWLLTESVTGSGHAADLVCMLVYSPAESSLEERSQVK